MSRATIGTPRRSSTRWGARWHSSRRPIRTTRGGSRQRRGTWRILSHPSIPTTYHFWSINRDTRRGPGYLRRWIEGETIAARITRLGAGDAPFAMQVLRAAGGALAYLHDSGYVHGAFAPETVWVSPTRRLWLLGWQWAVLRDTIPPGLTPDPRWIPMAPEWESDRWAPDPRSDQWQLAALCFALLTGELPPVRDVPPIRWVRPECPQALADVLDRGLQAAPSARFPFISALLRALERVTSARASQALGDVEDSDVETLGSEQRLRWALGDDYEVLSPLGAGPSDPCGVYAICHSNAKWRSRCCTLRWRGTTRPLHVFGKKRSWLRNSLIRRSCRFTIGTAAGRSPGIPWNSPKAAPWPISWFAAVRGPWPRLPRKSISFSTD